MLSIPNFFINQRTQIAYLCIILHTHYPFYGELCKIFTFFSENIAEKSYLCTNFQEKESILIHYLLFSQNKETL